MSLIEKYRREKAREEAREKARQAAQEEGEEERKNRKENEQYNNELRSEAYRFFEGSGILLAMEGIRRDFRSEGKRHSMISLAPRDFDGSISAEMRVEPLRSSNYYGESSRINHSSLSLSWSLDYPDHFPRLTREKKVKWTVFGFSVSYYTDGSVIFESALGKRKVPNSQNSKQDLLSRELEKALRNPIRRHRESVGTETADPPMQNW